MRTVSLHGPRGLYIHGSVDDHGSCSLHGPKGTSLHGRLSPRGMVDLYDSQGKHYHGSVDESGHMSLHGPQGVFLHGAMSSLPPTMDDAVAGGKPDLNCKEPKEREDDDQDREGFGAHGL
jgi:hypothetical protein